VRFGFDDGENYGQEGSTLLPRKRILHPMVLSLVPIGPRERVAVHRSAQFSGKLISDNIFKDIVGPTRLFIVDGLYVIH